MANVRKNTTTATINNDITEVKSKKEIQLTDRVFLENTRNWELGFRAVETQRDITIPPNAKKFAQLNVGEVMAQIQEGNGMFCGTDSFGNNAYLKILDEDIRRYVFSLDENDNNDPVILDINSVKALLGISNKADFMAELSRLVVTEGDKKMIIPLAKEVGIDNVAVYKRNEIENISNYKF